MDDDMLTEDQFYAAVPVPESNGEQVLYGFPTQNQRDQFLVDIYEDCPTAYAISTEVIIAYEESKTKLKH